MARKKMISVYDKLLIAYGAQGWWPLKSLAREKSRLCDARGYHRGNYSLPRSLAQRFEIAVGAILTQNTAWKNVEKAMYILMTKNMLSPEKILKADIGELRTAIRSSGYYNEKAKKLKSLANLFFERGGLRVGKKHPSREALLETWGIGEETADSILLYAFSVPLFVVDAYTRRIFERLGMIGEKAKYTDIQELFQENLRGEAALYNEYHALIVEHAKQHCLRTPLCGACPLGNMCVYHQNILKYGLKASTNRQQE
jgi:endonuclease-3 related protein